MHTMAPSIAALAVGTLQAVRDIAETSGKLPIIAALRTPQSMFSMELRPTIDWSKDSHRAQSIVELRNTAHSDGAKAIAFACPDHSQARTVLFYIETVGACWLGKSRVEYDTDGIPNVLTPDWDDGKNSMFYPLLPGNPQV